MNHDNEDDINIDAMLNEIREGAICNKSRYIYMHSYAKFIEYLIANIPELITDEFARLLHSDDGTIVPTLHVIKNNKNIKPIKFENLSAESFMSWLLTLKKHDGSVPRYATYTGHRSGLFNLYRDYEVLMSEKMKSELKILFKGLKRHTAQQIAKGEESIKVGKDPLSFDLYRFICKSLLQETSREHIFCHAALTLSWNLMCRTGIINSVL